MKILHNPISALLLCAVIFVPASRGEATPEEFNRHFISASKLAKSSVVMLTAYKTRAMDGKTLVEKTAYGTGTCVIENRYIVTNYHVLQKGDRFMVTHNGMNFTVKDFPGGAQYLYDAKTDIALLNIETQPGMDLRPISLCDSGSIDEGEWVIAIGNPYGLSHSITGGIVSSKGRDNIGFSDIEDFIQSDVPINPGNSGGPLVNLKGEMVGLNTAIKTDTGGFQGISFSIPSNIVIQVCRELIEYGRVRRGWLGFVIREKNYDSGKAGSRVEILRVVRDSPSDAAGLRKGDFIREIDGKSVTSIGMIMKHIGTKNIGSKVNLTVSRDGMLRDFRLVMREKSEYKIIRQGLQSFFNDFGVEIDEDADSEELIVTRVTPQGVHYGFREGDIIISVNKRKVASLEDLVREYRRDMNRIGNCIISRDSRYHKLFFTHEKNTRDSLSGGD